MAETEKFRVEEKMFRWKYETESAAKRERLRRLSKINIGDQADRWSAKMTKLSI